MLVLLHNADGRVAANLCPLEDRANSEADPVPNCVNGKIASGYYTSSH
jgi:hypothetical protein